jgi:hypothetical protein
MARDNFPALGQPTAAASQRALDFSTARGQRARGMPGFSFV